MILMKKNYNPCGDLTGREREICDAALTSYVDLPFVQVMRNVTLAEISTLGNREQGLGNKDKIIDWASYGLNEIESRACINFNSTEFSGMSTLEIGLFKYFIHLLFENRYNIFYNHLVKFCADENISVDDKLEYTLNRAAQEGDYFTSLNTLKENFRYEISRGGLVSG